MRQFVSLMKKCFLVYVVAIHSVIQWGVEIGRNMRSLVGVSELILAPL